MFNFYGKYGIIIVNFQERLQIVVKQVGNANKLAKATNISASSIGKYITGEADPSRKRLIRIAKAGKVNPTWLLTGELPMHPGDHPGKNGIEETAADYSGDELKKNGFTLVPRYDVQVSLGSGALVDSEQIVEHLAFKTIWLKKEMNLEPGKLALISTIGDSMSPTIRDGDLLLVDMRQRQIGDDAIYIIRRDSYLVAKRFQRLFDGTVSIKSDNPIYKEEVVPRDAVKELSLIGRVVWIGRKA